MSDLVISNYIKKFPFPELRERQSDVLKEIDESYASGYKSIILEAPTGFGKGPVSIATALTLGSSYLHVYQEFANAICKRLSIL